MNLRILLLWGAVAFALVFIGFFALSPRHRDEPVGDLLAAPLWQRMAAPGELSKPHAFLENDCAACHTSVKGIEAKNCAVCHIDNTAILQRQPTAFHANIAECAACHREHQGRLTSTTRMDHQALARIGERQLQEMSSMSGQDRANLVAWLTQSKAESRAPHLHAGESMISCVTCHDTKDKHRGFFGTDCGQCHATATWTLAEFRHPSAASQSCVQCHQAPPSHSMMHFQMISMKTAGVAKAEVNQCFLCHQTTSWNDIRGVGYYKHH